MAGKKTTKQTTKKTPKKTGGKKRSNPAGPWFLRSHILAWIFVVLVTLVALVAVLRLPSEQGAGRNAVAQKPVKQRAAARVSLPDAPTYEEKNSPRVSSPAFSSSETQVYEEEDNGLDTRVKEVDLAVIQTLVLKGYDLATLVHGSVDIRTYHGREYHFQRLELARPEDAQGFVTALKKNLALLVEGASLSSLEGEKGVRIQVFGVPTHRILFGAVRQSRGDTGNVPGRRHRMVIVVDDLGRSVRAAKRLAHLSFPVTFSVMPHETRSREVAAIAGNAEKELILHLPMQPVSYPGTNPGKGALFVDMTPEKIRETLLEDLARVPGARGANNHMGSLFTQDVAGMETVLDLFKTRSLFFLDSMTTRKSCVRKVMARRNMPYLRRNVFLDNVRDEKAILFQLRKAESLAGKHGYAIAIGHPYPETLNALEIWQRERSVAVVPVRLRDLL